MRHNTGENEQRAHGSTEEGNSKGMSIVNSYQSEGQVGGRDGFM